MIWLGILMGIPAAALLAYVRFGRRDGITPHCRKCGFELIGIFDGADPERHCPECGRALHHSNTIRIGQARKRPWSLTGGILFAVASVALLGVGVWQANIPWTRYKPAFWLVLEANHAEIKRADAALEELLRRTDAGELKANWSKHTLDRVIERWSMSTASTARAPSPGGLYIGCVDRALVVALLNGHADHAQMDVIAEQAFKTAATTTEVREPRNSRFRLDPPRIHARASDIMTASFRLASVRTNGIDLTEDVGEAQRLKALVVTDASDSFGTESVPLHALPPNAVSYALSLSPPLGEYRIEAIWEATIEPFGSVAMLVGGIPPPTAPPLLSQYQITTSHTASVVCVASDFTLVSPEAHPEAETWSIVDARAVVLDDTRWEWFVSLRLEFRVEGPAGGDPIPIAGRVARRRGPTDGWSPPNAPKIAIHEPGVYTIETLIAPHELAEEMAFMIRCEPSVAAAFDPFLNGDSRVWDETVDFMVRLEER